MVRRPEAVSNHEARSPDLSILLVASIHMRVHAVGRKELEKEELRRGRRRHKARAPVNRVNSPAMPMRGMISAVTSGPPSGSFRCGDIDRDKRGE